MLKENSFTKRSLEELNKTDKDFSDQLKLLTENSISAFELLSLIVGDNEFIKDFDNIYFHGFDLTNFDTRYIFDENVSDWNINLYRYKEYEVRERNKFWKKV